MEIYKNIPGYYGDYTISNYGNIKSYKRLSSTILKPVTHKLGYMQLSLSINGKRRMEKVHRLVLLTFIGESKQECNHIDGDKSNNRVENLEYCTRSDNLKHKYRELGYKGTLTGLYGKDHPRSKEVYQYTKEKVFLKKYSSLKEAADILGISGSAISRGCLGKAKTVKGYIWKYNLI